MIDCDGVIRFVQHYRSTLEVPADGILQVLDDLEEKRALIGGLKDKGPELTEAASLVLGPLGAESKKALVPLIQALQDRRPDVRLGAASALCWLGFRAEAAVPALAKALEDEDRRVRRLSVEALARIGPPAKAAAPALVRAMAATAIEDTDGFEHWDAVVAVIALLKDKDAAVRVRAAYLLDHRADTAVPTLIRALQHEDARIRARTAELLGQWAPGSAIHAIPVLRRMLVDQDIRVRQAAAEALKKIEALKKTSTDKQ